MGVEAHCRIHTGMSGKGLQYMRVYALTSQQGGETVSQGMKVNHTSRIVASGPSRRSLAAYAFSLSALPFPLFTPPAPRRQPIANCPVTSLQVFHQLSTLPAGRELAFRVITGIFSMPIGLLPLGALRPLAFKLPSNA